jgi:hypothetical protein
MGNIKYQQVPTVRLSAAVPHSVRQCRIAAVPLQGCGTAALPGPLRFAICGGWSLGYIFVEVWYENEHLVALFDRS